MQTSALQQILAQKDALYALARNIHANPELGYEEHKACAWQTELLWKWGFTVQCPYASVETSFRAEIGSGKPVFAFVSEYDALPGLGHACGHNLIATAALAAAKAAADILTQNNLPGTIAVIGTPAEEGHGGKIRLLENHGFAGIDAAMMTHPMSRNYACPGKLGVYHMEVEFFGQAAHASGAPEQGRNALDAAMLLFHGINAWRQHLPEDTRVHGIIAEGGDAANIVPEYTRCPFYLRARDIGVLKRMLEQFAKIAEGAALMTNTRANVTQQGEPYLPGRPNPPLDAAWLDAMEKQGLPVDRNPPPGKGSSDFGNLSSVVPGTHGYVDICDGTPAALHTKEFCAQAGSNHAIEQALKAGAAMAEAAIRFLTDVDLREQTRKAFEQSE